MKGEMMHRLLLVMPSILVILLGTSVLSLATPSPDDLADDPLTSFIEKNGGGGTGDGTKAGQVQNNGAIRNLEVIGHNDIGNRGFNADIYAYKGFAYIGQWGFGISNIPKFCPSGDKSGVKVLDLRAPGIPIVATLQNPPRTSAEDIVVYTAGGRDIAAIGIQTCFRTDNSIPRGLQLFDVTNARNPVLKGFLPSGDNIRGVHELSVVQRPDLGKVLALQGVNYSETYDAAHRGGLRIADVTDPAHPVEIGNWSLASIGVTNQFSGVGCFARTYVHAVSASHDGRTAYISAIDGGEIVVDITTPSAPAFVRRAAYPVDQAGDMDTHSSTETPDARYLYVEDEDECQSNDSKQQPGWGFLRIFDLASRDAAGNLVQVGEFRTENSLKSKVSNGLYSIHHTAVNAAWGGSAKVAVSWYSDGVRILDITPVRSGTSRSPTETAYFVPPAANDPVGSCACLGNSAFVWGVVVTDDGLIVISDMNSGAWVLRETQ